MNRAISEAIAQEMERDPSVFVMGEDVGKYGGIFGATTGLFDKFGPERIKDTPISESAFFGGALGAASKGMRPIAELMFVDFFGVAMDQIYNHIAKSSLYVEWKCKTSHSNNYWNRGRIQRCCTALTMLIFYFCPCSWLKSCNSI